MAPSDDESGGVRGGAEYQRVHGTEMGNRRKATERAILEAAEYHRAQGVGGFGIAGGARARARRDAENHLRPCNQPAGAWVNE